MDKNLYYTIKQKSAYRQSISNSAQSSPKNSKSKEIKLKFSLTLKKNKDKTKDTEKQNVCILSVMFFFLLPPSFSDSKTNNKINKTTPIYEPQFSS